MTNLENTNKRLDAAVESLVAADFAMKSAMAHILRSIAAKIDRVAAGEVDQTLALKAISEYARMAAREFESKPP